MRIHKTENTDKTSIQLSVNSNEEVSNRWHVYWLSSS